MRTNSKLLVASVVTLAAGLTALAVQNDGEDRRRERRGRRHRVPGVPATLIAVSGRYLVVADGSTGTVQLDVPVPRGLRPLHVSVAPAGPTVYVSASGRACENELLRLALPGGAWEPLGSGDIPAISPDGRRLAFALPGPPCATSPRLVVRDLVTGRDRVWAAGSAGGPGRIPLSLLSLSWAEDSRHLAFILQYRRRSGGRKARPGDTDLRMIDVDVDVGGRLLTSSLIEPPDEDAAYLLASFRSRFGSIAALEACCGPDPAEFRVVSIDTTTGEQLTPLLDPGGRLRSMDFDVTGWHLLFVTEDPERLLRWSGDEPVELGSGFLSAAW